MTSVRIAGPGLATQAWPFPTWFQAQIFVIMYNAALFFTEYRARIEEE